MKSNDPEAGGARQTAGGNQEQIVVLDPLGRNAELICQTLAAAGLECRAVPTAVALLEAIDEGAGVLVFCSRVLDERTTTRLRGALQSQPLWSDIPLIILVARREEQDALDGFFSRLGERANVLALSKPVWPAGLVSAVQAALNARRHQYEIRALQETLEQRVAKRTQKIRELAVALTEAEQQERQRVSQILHDDLQQLLFSLRIQMGFATSAAGQNAELVAHLEDMGDVLSEAMEMTRTLTVELSPPELQARDLGMMLSLLAEHMSESYQLEVDVEAEGGLVVGDDGIRLLLFQAVRELLFNTVKHAQVGQARLRLWRENEHSVIEVSDEGAGFEVEPFNRKTATGFGLPRVTERVRLLGGEIVIDTAPQQGTRVRLLLPLGMGQ